MKGLGVDQVVAFEIVTANGSIVYMTEEGKDILKLWVGARIMFSCVYAPNTYSTVAIGR